MSIDAITSNGVSTQLTREQFDKLMARRKNDVVQTLQKQSPELISNLIEHMLQSSPVNKKSLEDLQGRITPQDKDTSDYIKKIIVLVVYQGEAKALLKGIAHFPNIQSELYGLYSSL